MPKSFLDILRRRSPKPQALKDFVRSSSGIDDPWQQQDWLTFANAYHCAFEELAELMRAEKQLYSMLRLPMLYLCRHSIELHLKWALTSISPSVNFDDGSHDLLRLWKQLKKVTNDGNSDYDLALKNLHDVDPKGLAFRYPTNRNASALPYMSVKDLKKLVEAHRAICSVCDYVVTTRDG